jgi:PKD repeat protein
MKKNKSLLFLLSLILFITACKKKEITTSTTTGNPPFYFNGTINGVQTNIQAGINNYYMFTSYALDGNGVYDFTGEFRNSNCSSNCPNSLKIYIKDYRQYSVAPTTIDSAIMPGYYSFATPAGTASKYSVQFFDTLYNGTALTYSWTFGDGAVSNQNKPLHIYSHPGVYSVSLNALSTTSCSSSLNNNVVVGQTGGHVQLQFSNTSTVNVVNFASTTGGGQTPYSFNWDFGDGNTLATGSTPACTHTYTAAGVYAATLTRTDAANAVEIYHKNVATQSATTCSADFYPTFITPLANPMNLANVTIEWHDASGNLYTTSNNSQPNKSMFQIISVSNYQNNISGQPTKIIHAKVTCTLYNGTNSILLNGDVTFSIAHL